ncbi:MAG: LLM class F420-dependent oxidoreductase [Acidimicrobiia bacterium]
MRIGIFGGAAVEGGSIDAIVGDARTAAEQGFASYWLPQIFGVDALTTLAVVGREVPTIELGTAVVPTYPRHPMMLAAQARTVQAATGSRLTLGIGLSHKIVIENMLGYSFAKPGTHMREYLSILMPLIHGEPADFDGDDLHAHLALSAIDGEPCPVLVAALGVKMLELAGSLADGTILWMTGPTTVASHTVPTVTRAAEAAGRPAPRVAAGVPVCVTSDVDGGRERAARVFAVYGTLPSYRAMLDAESLDGPADLAVVGDEATVTAGLERFADAGVTELAASEFGGSADERTRTRELLRSLL